MLDTLEELAGEAALAGMCFAGYGAKVEILVCKGVAFVLLGEQCLQRDGQLAQAGSFRPGMLVVNRLCEEAVAAPGAGSRIGPGANNGQQ